MPILRHILFDNDGTLIDSEILAARTMLRMLQRHGLTLDEQEYSRRFPGLVERDILRILCDDHCLALPEDFTEQLRTEHGDVFRRELRAIPGMTSIFRQLRVPKSIVSNGSVRHVERTLRRVRLYGALDGQIFSAEHVEKPKPHPDVYQLALRKLGLKPEEALVVEDSATGVAAARQAGLRVVGFLGAAHVYDGHEALLREQGADFIAPDATALRRLFASFGIL